MTVQLQILKNADGSVEIKENGITVVCGINGPMKARPRQELATTSYLEVIIKPDTGNASTREKLMEDRIKSFVDNIIVGSLYPRSLIQLNLQILEKTRDFAGGFYDDDLDVGPKIISSFPELSCCINAAFLALVNANISINMAFNSTLFQFTDSLSLYDGHSAAKSIHLVVYGIKDGKINRLLLSENAGKFSEKKLLEVIQVAKTKSIDKFDEMSSQLRLSLDKNFIFVN